MICGYFPVTKDWVLFNIALFYWLSLSLGLKWKVKSILIPLGTAWLKVWLCWYLHLMVFWVSGSGQPLLGVCRTVALLLKTPCMFSLLFSMCIWQMKLPSRSRLTLVPVNCCFFTWLGVFLLLSMCFRELFLTLTQFLPTRFTLDTKALKVSTCYFIEVQESPGPATLSSGDADPGRMPWFNWAEPYRSVHLKSAQCCSGITAKCLHSDALIGDGSSGFLNVIL